MSLRLAGSPFHAQATIKLSAASDSAQRRVSVRVSIEG